MTDLKALGDAWLRDFVTDGVPGSGRNEPIKSDGRAFVAAIAGEINVLAAGQNGSLTAAATWLALSALTGTTAGQTAEVPESDTGTHIDPVSGDTVANAGRYSWSVEPPGWHWISAQAFISKADKAQTLSGGGLAQTSGTLGASPTVSVPAASPADTIAGTLATAAVTPEGDKAALDARIDVFPATDASGAVVTAVAVDGRAVPLLAQDGRLLQALADGTIEPVVSGGTLLGEVGPHILVGGERAHYVRTDAAGRIVYALTADGGLWSADDSGAMRRVNLGFATEVPTLPLLDGLRILYAERDEDDRITLAVTEDRAWYVATAAGLTRIGPLTPDPPAYAGQAYTADAPSLVHYHADPATHWELLIGLGQSGMEGYTEHADDTLLATAPLHPDHIWMLDGGLGPRLPSTTGSPQYGGKTLVPLVEQADGFARETFMSGWASHFWRRINTATGATPNMACLVSARGGKRYMELKRGGPERPYGDMLLALADLVAACRARGARTFTPTVMWDQGDSDNNAVTAMTARRYAAQMKQMARDLQEDICKVIGETVPVVVLITQQMDVGHGVDAFDSPVRLGETMVHGDGNIRLVGPEYWAPIENGAGLHQTSVGKNYVGQAVAHAHVEERYGCGWRGGVYPERWYWLSSTQIRIEFDCPTPPLVLDTSNAWVSTVGLINGTGLEFDDGSGTPPAVTAASVSSRFLDLTLAARPANIRNRVALGLRRNTGATKNGPVVGGRSILRDSTVETNLYDATPVPLHWAPSFVLDLPPAP